MRQFSYRIKSVIGIHMLPATKINQEAEHFKSRVTITKDGTSTDGKSLLGLIALSVKKNDLVTVQVEGDDEKEACDALQKHFTANL